MPPAEAMWTARSRARRPRPVLVLSNEWLEELLLQKQRPTGLQQHVGGWQAPEAVLGGYFPG